MLVIGSTYTFCYGQAKEEWKIISNPIEVQALIEDTASEAVGVDTAPTEPAWDTKSTWEGTVEVSAYTASVAETDSTPTITASGETVYEGGIASNCYDFGTKIELEGLGEFTVNDRMNSRYGCDNADIFLWDYNNAIQFGRQNLKYRVIE